MHLLFPVSWPFSLTVSLGKKKKKITLNSKGKEVLRGNLSLPLTDPVPKTDTTPM